MQPTNNQFTVTITTDFAGSYVNFTPHGRNLFDYWGMSTIMDVMSVFSFSLSVIMTAACAPMLICCTFDVHKHQIMSWVVNRDVCKGGEIECVYLWFLRTNPRINTTEKTLLEKINSRTLLLISCVMSSYFKLTISDCSVASILYTLWLNQTVTLYYILLW